MKKIILIGLALIFATFTASAQTNVDLEKYLGDWTFTFNHPMTNEDTPGAISFVKEDDVIRLSINGVAEKTVKSSKLTVNDNGTIQTSFYVDEYDFDVPLDLVVVDDDNIKASIDAGGFYVAFTMKRTK